MEFSEKLKVFFLFLEYDGIYLTQCGEGSYIVLNERGSYNSPTIPIRGVDEYRATTGFTHFR